MRTVSSRRFLGHGAAAGVVAAAAGAAWGQLDEHFDDWVPVGWRAINRSQFASGPQGWEQASFSPFWAHSEPAFAASSPAANTQTGIISTWLTSPPVSLHNGDTLDFWVKSLGENPDRMQVRMSTAGTNGNPGSTPTSVGVFTTLLLDINPTYEQTGFPTEWTHYTLYVSGLSAPATGMFRVPVLRGARGHARARAGVMLGSMTCVIRRFCPGRGRAARPTGHVCR
jgi:hypothetical protein